ncbi:hypothetical protein [Prosthecobacter debontii]|uniref:hypothetical protein n=1 Tax=Prosthecobacter debontii TaxID=48467 RepID=UPI00111775EE|nr:hypothetical protein [Prosthecobacter debontii]
MALRIAWIKSQVDEKAKERAEGTVLSILEKRLMAARICRAKPSDARMDNPDCELVMTKMGPVALFPSKAAMIKIDNDLAGEGSEAKGNDAMAELLKRLRK